MEEVFFVSGHSCARGGGRGGRGGGGAGGGGGGGGGGSFLGLAARITIPVGLSPRYVDRHVALRRGMKLDRFDLAPTEHAPLGAPAGTRVCPVTERVFFGVLARTHSFRQSTC